jgi:Arc/MetJ-type ribon-helix-helix transcriptional regulator
MKNKLSISVEEAMIKKIDGFVEEGIFRNKSHCIEFALGKLMENTE